MLQTKAPQKFQQNGVELTAVLFTRIRDVFFKNSDNRIIVYVEKGYKRTVIDEATNESTEKLNLLANVANSFSQEEVKTMLVDAGIVFNEAGTNLLIDEQNSANDAILASLIAADSTRFFGYSSELWETV